MRITGVIGLRSMEYREKAWHSPSYSDFVWKDRVAYSTCNSGCQMEDGQIAIRRSCSCGIHLTLWPDEFLEYMLTNTSIAFLVQALGWVDDREKDVAHTWAHDFGITTSGAVIMAVVNWSHRGRLGTKYAIGKENATIIASKQKIAMDVAARFFDVPIWDIDVIPEMLKIQWTKHNLLWHPVLESAWRSVVN